MITEKATVTKIRPRVGHSEIQVMTEEDLLLFLVELPWYQLGEWVPGMELTITYAEGDQFATIVKEAVKL